MALILVLLAQPCMAVEGAGMVANEGAAAQTQDAEAEALRLNKQVGRLASQGRVTEAIPLARRALELSEQVHGKVHRNVSADLITLASLYSAQGDFFNAEPLIHRAIEIDEQLYGSQHPEVAVDKGGLANLHRQKGDLKEAVKLYSEALETFYAKPVAARYLNSIAEVHRGYGQALLDLNRYEDALLQHLSAEQIYEKIDPDRAVKVLIDMAEIDRRRGNPRRAEVWLGRAQQLKGD